MFTGTGNCAFFVNSTKYCFMGIAKGGYQLYLSLYKFY